MNVRECDNCGHQDRPDVPWLAVRLPDSDHEPWNIFERRGKTWDFCSWSCVQEFAVIKAIEKQVRE